MEPSLQTPYDAHVPEETTSIKRTGFFIEFIFVTGRHDRRTENNNVHIQPIYSSNDIPHFFSVTRAHFLTHVSPASDLTAQ